MLILAPPTELGQKLNYEINCQQKSFFYSDIIIEIPVNKTHTTLEEYVLYKLNLGMWVFGARVVKRNRPGLKKKMKSKEGRNSASLKTARPPRRRGSLAQKF